MGDNKPVLELCFIENVPKNPYMSKRKQSNFVIKTFIFISYKEVGPSTNACLQGYRTQAYLTSMNFDNARQEEALKSSSAYFDGLPQIAVNNGPNIARRLCPEFSTIIFQRRCIVILIDSQFVNLWIICKKYMPNVTFRKKFMMLS